MRANIQALHEAIFTPFISSKKGLETYNGLIREGKKDVVIAQVNKRLKAQMDAFLGRNTFQKSLEGVAGNTVANLDLYKDYANELTLDEGWRSAFAEKDARTATTAEVIDWETKVKWKALELKEKIDAALIAQTDVTRFDPIRYGAGVSLNDFLVERNSMYSINEAMQAIQIANVSFWADHHYELIAATTGVSTTTITANTIDAQVEGLNQAIISLISANQGKGYNISANQAVVLYANAVHRPLVNRIIARGRGDNNDNEIVEFPVQTRFTYNSKMPSTIASKKAVMLVLPRLKNMSIYFRGMRMVQETDFSTGTVDILADQQHKSSCDATQKYILNLEA